MTTLAIENPAIWRWRCERLIIGETGRWQTNGYTVCVYHDSATTFTVRVSSVDTWQVCEVKRRGGSADYERFYTNVANVILEAIDSGERLTPRPASEKSEGAA